MPDGIFVTVPAWGNQLLYSALNVINKPDWKIINVEDPVEYEVPGINQVQVRSEVGMTFSAALRAMFRTGTEIITMVGKFVTWKPQKLQLTHP